MSQIQNRTQSLVCGMILAAASIAAGAADDDIARPLLMQAMENQYHGRYQATMTLVNENFAEGRDSLAGWVEFADDVGERKICLAGPKRAFEYKSLNYGKEQWITDDNSTRIRRIANRQWKKGVFGNLLTYEDMLKLPVDFFMEYSSCKGVKTTDSTYQICMSLKPLFQSFYSRIDVTLGKSPVLLKGMTFYGTHGEKLKTLEITGYREVEGKWLMTDMSFADADSLAALKMCFRNFSFTETPQAQKERLKNEISLASKRPLMLPTGVEGAGGGDAEAEVEADN